MTRLAAHADFREARGEAVGRRVVILAHAGRMAPRAHEIPVLVQPGPVQHVVVLDLLVRIEMKPALAALLLRPAVPGERQRLQAAVGKLDQILLQWLDAERVLDFKRRQPAVGPIGLDEKLPILAEEARIARRNGRSRIAEIAEHRFVARHVAWQAGAASRARAALAPGGSRHRSRCRRRWLPSWRKRRRRMQSASRSGTEMPGRPRRWSPPR